MKVTAQYSFARRLRLFWDELTQTRHELHLLAEISQLRAERDAMAQKCGLMERVLMPISGPAGSAYVRSANPQEPRKLEAVPRSSWQQVQADHEKFLADEEAKDKLRKESKAS